MIKILIPILNTDLELTMDDARALYNELGKVFKNDRGITNPIYPDPPIWPFSPSIPWYIWKETTTSGGTVDK